MQLLDRPIDHWSLFELIFFLTLTLKAYCLIFQTYEESWFVLQSLSERKDVDWVRINAFHMDEYIDLEAIAPQGFGNFLKFRLFVKLLF